jgi:broad specificity phosphatase PhoE
MGMVFFVRHGEAENNKRDILSSSYEGFPLTENGRTQVKATAEQLKGIKFDRVYSSPLLRTKQTAEILVEGRDLDIKIDERLRERGTGNLEGKEAHNGNWIMPILRKREYLYGVESYDSIVERIKSFIESIPNEGNTLVATHESPISILACDILGFVEFTGKGIKVGNASVTIIDIEKKAKPHLIALGSYSIDSEYLEKVLGQLKG